MDVTPLIKQGQQVIQSYANSGFRVNGERYDGAVIVTPDDCLVWDTKRNVSNLKEIDFEVLLNMAPDIDVVLLGCGKDMEFLPISLKNTLKAKGLNVEVMDTGAACRTYNVLMAEGRRVAAALLPV